MLAGVFHTNAQDSIRQFPNSNEKPLWVTKTIFPSCGEEVKYHYYGMMGDTIINSKQYKKIYCLSDSIVEPEYIKYYFGALREELGNVYVKRSFHTEEVLMFDYSTGIGETICYSYILVSPTPIVLDSIDTLTLDGVDYRRYWKNSYGEWIEGIGNTAWDVFNIVSDIPEDCSWVTLSCFKQDSMLIYGDDCGGEDVSSLNVVEPKQVSPIEFYPNPVNDHLYYKFNHLLEGEKCEIKIIDLSGKLVYEDVLSSGNNAISLNYVNSGMYILKIVFKDSTFNEVLVIDNN